MFKKRLDLKITALVIGIFILGFGMAITVNLEEVRRNLLELNKDKVQAVTFMIVKSIQNVMLLGDGQAAGDLIEDMQGTHDIEEITILRTNGREAFKDMETINMVNKVLDDKRFEREPKISNLLMNPNNRYFKRALETGQTVEYYETKGDVEIFTQLTPLENREECQGCHGSENNIRGILKISARMKGIQDKLSLSRGHMIGYAFLILLAVSLALKFTLNRTVLMPIRRISAAVRNIADGNLQKVFRCESEDEIGKLGCSLNAMAGRLREIIQQLLELISVLSHSSYNIFSSSQDIAGGADNQAALVLRASSAIDEMSSAIQSILSTVNDAAKSAEAATQLADGGAIQVEETGKEITVANNLVKELNDQAKGIKKISQFIQEIAAQTNILALNAAIEASRAGEQGKGFNVISHEIRTLANKTSQSADEISRIIDTLQWKMLESTQIMSSSEDMVHKAGDSLKNIVEGITSTNDMVRTIASFTNQQAKTSQEIAESLQDISRISQHTAAKAKESVESNKGISDISGQLQEIAQRFRL